MDDMHDFDLGPLTWVKAEIDNALATAKRQLTNWNGSDLATIKTAATHLHQVFGALQIVDLQGVSQVCEACEGLLVAMDRDPALRNQASAQVALQAIDALQGYLDRLMAGGPHAELALSSIYQALLTQQGEAPPAPSDLFYPDLDVRASRLSPEPGLDDTHRNAVLRRSRSQYQKGLVQWLTQRDADAGLAQMQEALRNVEDIAPGTAQYTFWWAANGLLESLAQGSISSDIWLKRLLGRIDLQLKRLQSGSRSLAERVLRDVLFYQATSPTPAARSAEVRSLFDLNRYLPAPEKRDTAEQLRLRPILKSLRDGLESAKEHWLRFCSGKADALPGFQRTLNAFQQGALQLEHPGLGNLARQLDLVAQRLTGLPGLDQNEGLQLELATTLLFAQNALDHFDSLGPELDEQIDTQSRRLEASLSPDNDLATLPTIPLLDEFTRQAQEKLLLAQVTQEIQANLHQVENILDTFFRNRSERAGLQLVPGLMNQVLGALNMLQLETPADLVRMAMDQMAILAEPERDIGQDELDWIADAVSSLGLYVDALRYGKDDQAALRSLLSGPGQAPEQGDSLEDELRRQQDAISAKLARWSSSPIPEPERPAILLELKQLAQDAELVGNTALQDQVAQVLARLSVPEAPPASTAAEPGSADISPPKPATGDDAEPVAESTEDVDGELLDIYITEAHEVLDNITGGLARLEENPGDQEAFVDIRRGYHTLKGSGRMVGLTEPAEVAWEVEQTLNHWLRDHTPPSPAILRLMGDAAQAFRGWVEALETQGHARVEADEIVELARSLRAEAEPKPAPETSLSPCPADTPPATDAPSSKAGDEDAPQAPDTPHPESEEALTRVGDHTLPTPLFEIFSDEAGQRLGELQHHWAQLLRSATPEDWEALSRSAHTLAGIARTTGFTPLAEAAHDLEIWAREWTDAGAQPAQDLDTLVSPCIQSLEQQYRDILAGQFPSASTAHARDLPLPPDTEHIPEPDTQDTSSPGVTEPVQSLPDLPPASDQVAVQDELDPALVPIFLAEADELLPRIGESLRQWRSLPGDPAARQSLQRALHTLKGSARMAGALVLGEATHSMESRVLEQLDDLPSASELEALEHEYDHLADLVEHLRPSKPAPVAPSDHPADQAPAARLPSAQEPDTRMRQPIKARTMALDTLINETGEVSIARSRIETLLTGYKQTAEELTGNVERMRNQLRELEIQAETQMRAHLATSQDDERFDPLEFDRYTRLQELTRLMAESVNDVATAQESLLSSLGEVETSLAHQAKMTRSLQQHLMHIRMVPLNSQAERLHRIVRQAAKETGHKARLHIEGGETELDRSVLEKVFVPLEHLLRNAVAHGIESPEARTASGKPDYGEIRLQALAEGNEITLTLDDDGSGIPLDKVRQRAEALGWLKPGEAAGPDRLESFLFMPGLSTAENVTQVAGRGIGLDVVKNEIAGVGGRVRLESRPGQGTRFIIRLPLTLALAQVVLIQAAQQTYALPASMVALVREVRQTEWDELQAAGHIPFDGRPFPLRSLNQLTGQPLVPLEGRHHIVLLLRSGDERLALKVDALRGNAEIVVKNMGPQLARINGIAGATVLGDGRVALIINPFGLLEHIPQDTRAPIALPPLQDRAPLVMVVDDSLTVRKITSRLLTRAGYRVVTAKDGSEALEMLESELPAIMLLDIEMPRMDGFEVTRHIRANATTRSLPIIMITSRTAEKHRDHAFELGVDTFMGKPYQDEDLLGEIETLIHKA